MHCSTHGRVNYVSFRRSWHWNWTLQTLTQSSILLVQALSCLLIRAEGVGWTSGGFVSWGFLLLFCRWLLWSYLFQKFARITKMWGWDSRERKNKIYLWKVINIQLYIQLWINLPSWSSKAIIVAGQLSAANLDLCRLSAHPEVSSLVVELVPTHAGT